MNIYNMAKKVNSEVFNNQIDLDSITFEIHHKMIDGAGIAGITYGFITSITHKRISVIYIFTKYCKGKKFAKRVLIHEMVHAYQNQLKQKMNHNGAFMRYYCKKARALGYEIQMGRV